MVVAKYGEKSYSRCTSRRGRNNALKIIRIGLEKPVAVYSMCGVSPFKPQSHVGPMRIFEPRAKNIHNPSGTGNKHTAISVMPSVETVPPVETTPESTRPFATLS